MKTHASPSPLDGTTTIISDGMALPWGTPVTYSLTLTAPDRPGHFPVSVFLDADTLHVTATEQLVVGSPALTPTLEAPSVAGRDPFSIALTSENL